MRIDLASPTDVLGFRAQANSLLAHQVAPPEIDWEAREAPGCADVVAGEDSRPAALSSALHAIVPRSFVRLTELVVLHRDLDRFDLLYRLLWRLVHEPDLAAASFDAEMARVQGMAHAVRREISRIRQGIVWRPESWCDGAPLRVAWCEPRHYVTEEVAHRLLESEGAGPWLLASPERSVLCEHGTLRCGPGLPSAEAGAADSERWCLLRRQLAGPSEALA
jgi:DNA polymerase